MSVGLHCLSSAVGFSGPLLHIVPSLKHGSSSTALSGVCSCVHMESTSESRSSETWLWWCWCSACGIAHVRQALCASPVLILLFYFIMRCFYLFSKSVDLKENGPQLVASQLALSHSACGCCLKTTLSACSPPWRQKSSKKTYLGSDCHCTFSLSKLKLYVCVWGGFPELWLCGDSSRWLQIKVRVTWGKVRVGNDQKPARARMPSWLYCLFSLVELSSQPEYSALPRKVTKSESENPGIFI